MKPDVMDRSRAAEWAGVVGLSIAIFGCATATVQKPAHRPTTRLGVVRSLTGSASLERPPAIAIALHVKDEVITGDRVTTDDSSEAAIILAGRAELKMRASAAVTVTGGVDQFLLTVEKGLIIYTMADTEEVQQVVTPNTSLRLMGAIAFISVVTGARVQTTSVCAQRGSINAAVVGGGAVIVKEDQCVSTVNDRIGPSHPFSPSPLPPTGDTGSIKPIPPGTPTAWRATQRVPRGSAEQGDAMKHLTRAVLVVGPLLVVVGTAAAECGWVMNPPSNDRGTAGWLLKGGFRTLDECEKASAALRRYPSHEGAVVVPSFCACRFEWSQRDVQGQAVQHQRPQKSVTDERESIGGPGRPKDR